MNTHKISLKMIGICVLLVIMAFFTTTFPLKPKYAFFSSLSVILFALPCYYGIFQTFGKKSAIQLIFIMGIFAILIENIAIFTGFPYGQFTYGLLIGKRIGLVPWTVAFAYTPILFGAISLAQKWQVKASVFKRIGIAALLMTALDFVLDPASVSLGFWTWENPVGFYGVPWSNFLGWILSSVIAVSIVKIFLVMKKAEQISFSAYTHSSFILILFFWTAICLFERLWMPGLIGCVLLMLIKKYIR